MISPTNPKMLDARAAASRINHVSKGIKCLAVIDWALKVHAMLGTRPVANPQTFTLRG